ncbi:hypothetical protein REJ26_004303 [Providencia stuartii]|uniref:Uncharacterized protein n=2 Tax=Providencia TaxID=586 RepID=A0A8I2ISD3_9GAMM|nr:MULTISPECIES: hypothetical protein [Providencia]ELL8907220.1 hypothetical protein [Proteus mirabilis]ELQ1458762.1 hypothetical protein [Providencia rettgeri]ELR5046148.1 hypothetical protein [Providencia rettgeri]ELR5157796.1 hypothetical protein [Providencia rettgeri]ELR5233413.1 hypothetical protein [Providencia rettgeri]
MLDSYIGSLLKYLHQLDSLFRDTKVISALTCVIPPVENGCDDIGKCIEPVVNWGPHAYTSVIIIINTLTGEPHSAIHSHSDDILPDCKNYAYGIGYESATVLFVVIAGIESYYLALKAKAYLKNQNYLPLLIKLNGLNKHAGRSNFHY